MNDEIRNRRELVELVNEVGFLPFFSGRIEGFSLEENISYDAWYQGRWSGKIHLDAWDWKGQVLQNKELVYGKFFEKKAGFMSLKLWPDFCNYRRDGYYDHCSHLIFPESMVKLLLPGLLADLILPRFYSETKGFVKECSRSRIDLDEHVQSTIKE